MQNHFPHLLALCLHLLVVRLLRAACAQCTIFSGDCLLTSSLSCTSASLCTQQSFGSVLLSSSIALSLRRLSSERLVKSEMPPPSPPPPSTAAQIVCLPASTPWPSVESHMYMDTYMESLFSSDNHSRSTLFAFFLPCSFFAPTAAAAVASPDDVDALPAQHSSPTAFKLLCCCCWWKWLFQCSFSLWCIRLWHVWPLLVHITYSTRMTLPTTAALLDAD